MKKELASALNDQMVFELYSSYIYLGLAACLEKMKLPGAAHWPILLAPCCSRSGRITRASQSALR